MKSWLANLLEAARKQFSNTFQSFSNANYRIYLTGQLISLSGTSMQAVAMSWITYLMTGSAAMLGLVTAASSAPVLLLGLAGGLVADRFDKRRVLIIAQIAGLILATVLGVLYVTGTLQVWMILVLSVLQGIIGAFEMPTRQTFVAELVGKENTVNAVSLNSAVFNTTRLVGPALAAVTLTVAGAGVCFFLNAASFLGAVIALSIVRPHPRTGSDDTATGKDTSSVLDGLRFAIGHQRIRALLLATACLSFFGFQFVVLLPVVVDRVLGGNEQTLCLLSGATATGSLLGALFVASQTDRRRLLRIIPLASFSLSLCLLLLSWSSYTALAAVALFLTGAAVAIQVNATNSMLQLTAIAGMRGRVMSMYTVLMVGGVPFGSLVAGHIADVTSATIAIRMCGVACLVAAAIFALMPKGDDSDVQENP